MIGDLGRRAVAENSTKLREFTRARIFLTDQSILTTPAFAVSNEVKRSSMSYAISYRPTWKKKLQKAPFLITCDLYPTLSKRFNNFEEFKKDAEVDLASAFLLKWSNINENWFKRAEEYWGTHFYICVSWDEYFTHVENIYREANPDSDRWANHILSSDEYEIVSKIRVEQINAKREKSAHNSNEVRRERNAAKRLDKE